MYFIALAASDTLVLCLTATYYAVDFTFVVNLSDLSVLKHNLAFHPALIHLYSCVSDRREDHSCGLAASIDEMEQ